MPAITSSADVWAQDLLQVTFSAAMKNDDRLQNPDNYTITPLDDGIATTVTGVQTSNLINPTTIFLVVTQFSIGKLYRISFPSTPTLHLIDGTLTTPVPCKFIGRRTKQDTLIQSRPQMYDMGPDSLLRKLLQAFGRQDDLIGGSRKDKIFP